MGSPVKPNRTTNRLGAQNIIEQVSSLVNRLWVLHALPKGLQGALNGAPDSHHSPSSSLGRLPSAFRVPVVQVNRLIGINRRLGAGKSNRTTNRLGAKSTNRNRTGFKLLWQPNRTGFGAPNNLPQQVWVGARRFLALRQ